MVQLYSPGEGGSQGVYLPECRTLRSEILIQIAAQSQASY